MTANRAAQLVDIARRRDPDLVRLAEVASLAAQIEPEMLRGMRLALLPSTFASLEADLWFSPLAQSQTPEYLVLRSDILPLLRANLADPHHPVGLSQAWGVLHHIHQQSSATVRLEEQLTFLAMACEGKSGDRQVRLRRHMDRLLRQIVSEMSQAEEQARRLARWVVSMLPRLPAATRTLESFTLVRIAASLLLDGRSIVEGEAAPTASFDDLTLILPSNLARETVRVRLTAGGLEIGNLAETGTQSVEVPRTNPLFIQAAWRSNGDEHARLLSWQPQESRKIEAASSEFRLRTAVGELYTVRALQWVLDSGLSGESAGTVQSEAQTGELAPRPSIEPALPIDQLVTYPVLDFEVRVGPSEIVATNSSASVARSGVRLPRPLDLDKEWPSILASKPAATRLEQMRALGQRLFEGLLSGDVLQLFRASLGMARAQSSALRIRLNLDESTGFGALPWEWLYDPEQARFLALSAETLLVRYHAAATERARPPLAADVLRILVVMANPLEAPPVDTNRWRADLLAALGDSHAEVEFLEQSDWDALDAQLSRGQHHILLAIGYRDQESALILPDKTGRAQRAPLTRMLYRHLENLRAIILDTVQLDQPPTGHLADATARSLLEGGVPLVVTAQRTSRSGAEGVFWGEVLRRVAAGVTLDLALTEARKLAYGQRLDQEWGACAVHLQQMNVPGLFRRVQENVPQPERKPAAPLAPPLSSRVLVVVYDPVIDAGTGQRYSRAVPQPIEPLIDGFVADLAESSHDRIRYQVAARETLSEFPLFEDGYRYNAESYAAAQKSQQFSSGRFDYGMLLKQFDIPSRVGEGEFDEVWVFAPPGTGLYESRMAGTDAFWCNSSPISGVRAPRFVIMGFSLGQGVGEMLESYGHRAEAILTKVFEKARADQDLFKRFCRTEQGSPGQAEVGTMHLAPNSRQDYDWGNSRPVLSRCDTWFNFPDLSGAAREVDAREWGGGDIRQHHKWWFEHLPGAEGQAGNIAHDWWGYIVKPERVGRQPGTVRPGLRKGRNISGETEA